MRKKFKRKLYEFEQWHLRNDFAVGLFTFAMIALFTFWLVKSVIEMQNGGM